MDRSNHYGKWFRIPVLAPPQLGNRRFISRVAYEMESAEAFESDDLPASHACHHFFDRMTKPRAALRTANGFGMESATPGVGIVSRANIAHGETRHRSLGAIVRKVARDCISRPAMGAVDEGIEVKTASPIKEFIET